jgi:energy-coupling factor transport system permease protein
MLARRLVEGSLDHALDVAATLELRGYGLPGRATREPDRRSRGDRGFACAGLAIACGGLAARLAGVGEFEPYPELTVDAGPATLALATALPVVAALPFARRWGAFRGPSPARNSATREAGAHA